MRIIIAGAGEMGFYLAKLLTYENKDITLIDKNPEVLEYADTHLDVRTIKGDSSSLEILKQANVKDSKMILAITTSEKTNLLTAILAKKMGAKQTIARVSSIEYLDESQKDNFKSLGVDKLFCPSKLAALEIAQLIKQCSFTDIFNFEDGLLSTVGFTLEDNSPLVGTTIKLFREKDSSIHFKVVAILRSHTTIIPDGDFRLQKADHMYIITPKEHIQNLLKLIGKQEFSVKRIMIIGATDASMKTAQILENDYQVTLIEKDREKCNIFSEELSDTLIIHGNYSNIELLQEVGLSKMDAFIALTSNSETNIISSLMAETSGVIKTIAMVENFDYTHISQNIGIDTIINKKLIAANNIFRFVRKGQVEAIAGLHGVNAEIIEFVVHKQNQLVTKPIMDLPIPSKSIIGGLVRNNQAIIPKPTDYLKINDKVIVFAVLSVVSKVEKLFT